MAGEKILVVDDDQTILDIVGVILTEKGYRIIQAMDGEEGIAMAESNMPAIVILDRKMPGLDGNDVIKALKGNPETNAIPIIMMTGVNTITDVMESISLGARDYIVKPFEPSDFVMRVEKNLL